MPHPIHERYTSSSTPSSTPLTSPNTIAERSPLFVEGSLSPPSTPGLGFGSYERDTPREEYIGPKTPAGEGSRDKYLEDSPGFQDQDQERKRLVGNRQRGSFVKMDMEVQRLKEKDTKLKRNIRRFRFVVRSAHLACRTQDHLIQDDGELESAWGQTKTWPAMFMLVVASISALLSMMVLLSYMHSVKWANRFATMDAGFMIGASAVFLLIWAVSASLFHNREAPAFNVPNIWSWACNHKASSDDVVNFNQICITQEWSFICAIIEIALELLTIGSVLLIFLRRRSKSKVRKSERYSTFAQMNHEQSGMNSEYDEPSTPNRAFARLDGQEKEEYVVRKEMQ